MIAKINSNKENFQFSLFNFNSIFKFKIENLKLPIFLLIVFLLIYSRFVNIRWGLPYPFHPDERNMAASLQQLNCSEFLISNLKFKIENCFNPHFFAYGQLPLYLGYLFIHFFHLLTGKINLPITFEQATLSLRLISSLSSMINVFVLVAIIKLLRKRPLTLVEELISYLIIIFTPVFIQMAHFGTTESLLMLFSSLLVYCSLLIINNQIKLKKFVFLSGLISGLAIATKISSLIFLVAPILAIMSKIKNSHFAKASRDKQKSELQIKIKNFLLLGFIFCVFSMMVGLIFSPHNLISAKDFLSSLRYESDVALGNLSVFYTMQFVGTVPIIFQGFKIFPYVLGWPIYVLGLIGLFGMSWKDKGINFIRLSFLIYFLPNAFVFTKWTRFMAPVFPLMVVAAVMGILTLYDYLFINYWTRSNIKYQRSKRHIKNQNFYILICHFAFFILIFTLLIPGIAYLSVYQNPDVRVTASNWIYKNISKGSYLLSETANVVDLPLNPENYQYKSFDFYHLDESPFLSEDLKYQIDKADYVFIPSRRIFMNYSQINYPKLNQYYDELFSGKLGFKKIAEFSSYPKIEIFGKKIIEFPDEAAEETWTVFDHPVIRIYRKI